MSEGAESVVPNESEPNEQSNENANISHIFLNESSKNRPLVVMQVNGIQNGVKANLYIGENDEPNELATFFIAKLGMPPELKEPICEQIAKRKAAVQSKRSKRSARQASFNSDASSRRQGSTRTARINKYSNDSMVEPAAMEPIVSIESAANEDPEPCMVSNAEERLDEALIDRPLSIDGSVLISNIVSGEKGEAHVIEVATSIELAIDERIIAEPTNSIAPVEFIADEPIADETTDSAAIEPLINQPVVLEPVSSTPAPDYEEELDANDDNVALNSAKDVPLSAPNTAIHEIDSYEAEFENDFAADSERYHTPPAATIADQPLQIGSKDEIEPALKEIRKSRSNEYEDEFGSPSGDIFDGDKNSLQFEDDLGSIGNLSVDSMTEIVTNPNPSFSNAKYNCFSFRSISSGLRKSDTIGREFTSPLREHRYDLEWRRQQHRRHSKDDLTDEDLTVRSTSQRDILIDGDAEIYCPGNSTKRSSMRSNADESALPPAGDAIKFMIARAMSNSRGSPDSDGNRSSGISRQSSNALDIPSPFASPSSSPPQPRSKARAKDIELSQKREEQERRRTTILSKHAQRSNKAYATDEFIGANFHWAENANRDDHLAHKCPVSDTPQAKCPVCSGLNRSSKLNWKSIYEFNFSLPIPLIGQVKPTVKPIVLNAEPLAHPKASTDISIEDRERRKTDASWGGLLLNNKTARSGPPRFDESGEIIHATGAETHLPHNHIAIRPSYKPGGLSKSENSIELPPLVIGGGGHRRYSFTAEDSLDRHDHDFIHSPLGAAHLRESNNFSASGRVRWRSSRQIEPHHDKPKLQVQFDTSFYGTPTVRTLIESTTEVHTHVHPVTAPAAVHGHNYFGGMHTSDEMSTTSTSALVVGRAGRLPLLLGSKRQIVS